ncbi:OapC/ArvC family zinc-ribbon domain-containing protein [Natrinema marinum]|uniref:OapC/ArvC family zinc-ribbon domain-containing protein n=1 Tax=Natrinema marinum TaxID=2961598 RepID=UPI0020C85432|nr:Zn-ribbon containing protein [Natrinema marinum]
MPHQCTNCGRTFADGSKEMLSGCPDCGGNKFQFAPTATAAAESFDEGGGAGATATSGSPAATGTSDSADAGESDARPTSGSDSVTTRAAETVREFVSARSSDDGDGSWPSSAKPDPVERESPTDGEFEEWPETARRPEDRSDGSSEPAGPDDDTQLDAERPDPSSDRPTATLADDENSAQADARSEVVPSDDLPPHAGGTDQREPGHETAGRSVDHDGSTTAERDDDSPPEHGRVVSEPSGERPSIEELRAELNEQFESIKIVRPGQYELNLMELYNRDEYIISLQEDGRYVIDVPDSWRGDDGDD